MKETYDKSIKKLGKVLYSTLPDNLNHKEKVDIVLESEKDIKQHTLDIIDSEIEVQKGKITDGESTILAIQNAVYRDEIQRLTVQRELINQ